MLANILQLAGGILLAISSFIGKEGGFQVPVVGQVVPGTLEKFKQLWIVRIGLILLVAGYSLPMIDWDISLPQDNWRFWRFIISIISTGLLGGIGYKVAIAKAKMDFKKAPPFNPERDFSPGMIAIFPDENEANK